jgi:hypothetical protein
VGGNYVDTPLSVVVKSQTGKPLSCSLSFMFLKLLKHLKRLAEEMIGEANLQVCIISVPSYYQQNQRSEIYDVAAKAGFQVERVSNETTVAVLGCCRFFSSPPL